MSNNGEGIKQISEQLALAQNTCAQVLDQMRGEIHEELSTGLKGDPPIENIPQFITLQVVQEKILAAQEEIQKVIESQKK